MIFRLTGTRNDPERESATILVCKCWRSLLWCRWGEHERVFTGISTEWHELPSMQRPGIRVEKILSYFHAFEDKVKQAEYDQGETRARALRIIREAPPIPKPRRIIFRDGEYVQQEKDGLFGGWEDVD